MGSFSWLKADKLGKVANIVEGAPFKFLIPAEFGGGFVKDHYQDYGGWEPEVRHLRAPGLLERQREDAGSAPVARKGRGRTGSDDEGDRRVHRQEPKRGHRHRVLRWAGGQAEVSPEAGVCVVHRHIRGVRGQELLRPKSGVRAALPWKGGLLNEVRAE